MKTKQVLNGLINTQEIRHFDVEKKKVTKPSKRLAPSIVKPTFT